VLGCRREGIFHPHDNIAGGGAGLYTGAMRPGHVVEAEGLTVEVVDLREKA
jgi:STAM-binding protein